MPSTVFRRGESWCARVTVKGEQVWLGSRPTREEALELVAKARSRPVPASSVAEWFERWPTIANGRRKRKPETVTATLVMSRSFLRRFGQVPLTALDRGALVEWALEHPGAVRYARTVLADAVWLGLLESNPLAGIRSSSEELVVDPPTLLDVERLIGRAPEFGLPRAFVGVAAYSGLRLFEVAALEGRDIKYGLDSVELHVRAGKGGKSRRSRLLRPEFVQGVLPEAGLLFRRPLSRRPWDRRSVNRCWVKLREDVGVPDCRFHDLRHFHATFLLDRGASDLDVAVQLGHFDAAGRPNPELVRRRYGHPSHDAALARIGAVAA